MDNIRSYEDYINHIKQDPTLGAEITCYQVEGLTDEGVAYMTNHISSEAYAFSYNVSEANLIIVGEDRYMEVFNVSTEHGEGSVLLKQVAPGVLGVDRLYVGLGVPVREIIFESTFTPKDVEFIAISLEMMNCDFEDVGNDLPFVDHGNWLMGIALLNYEDSDEQVYAPIFVEAEPLLKDAKIFTEFIVKTCKVMGRPIAHSEISNLYDYDMFRYIINDSLNHLHLIEADEYVAIRNKATRTVIVSSDDFYDERLEQTLIERFDNMNEKE